MIKVKEWAVRKCTVNNVMGRLKDRKHQDLNKTNIIPLFISYLQHIEDYQDEQGTQINK